MHAQIRSVPALSPANLAAFLEVLSHNKVNIEAVGGGNFEQGGEFAFGLQHDDGDDGPYEIAMAALRTAKYKPRLVNVKYCALDNTPGQLLRCIAEAVKENQGTGRKIKDVAIGVPDAAGRIQVQVYSE